MTQHGKLPHGHGSLRSLWSELPPEVVQSCVDIEHEHAWVVAIFGKSTSSHELKPLGIAHRLQTFVLLLLMVALQTRARA